MRLREALARSAPAGGEAEHPRGHLKSSFASFSSVWPSEMPPFTLILDQNLGLRHTERVELPTDGLR